MGFSGLWSPAPSPQKAAGEYYHWAIPILVVASRKDAGCDQESSKWQWWANIKEVRRLNRADGSSTGFRKRALHPLVAEVIGHRLMNLIGIGTAPSVEIVSANEAKDRDSNIWLPKVIIGDRLRLQVLSRTVEIPTKTAKHVVLVEKIPKAIPLVYLRKLYGIDGEDCPIEPMRAHEEPEEFSGFGQIRLELWLGKDPLANPREFYADFSQPEECRGLRQAISWDSTETLAIHAARFFLGTTTAHSANILVDRQGRLYTVDFELVSKPLISDLRTLFTNIIPNTRAFEALRPVAELRERDIPSLFADLPDWTEWPLGSKEKTAEFYQRRLRLWKKLFQKAGVHSHSE